jgi:hypothetical protein
MFELRNETKTQGREVHEEGERLKLKPHLFLAISGTAAIRAFG